MVTGFYNIPGLEKEAAANGRLGRLADLSSGVVDAGRLLGAHVPRRLLDPDIPENNRAHHDLRRLPHARLITGRAQHSRCRNY